MTSLRRTSKSTALIALWLFGAAAAHGQAIPNQLGWHTLPGTRIRPHCPLIINDGTGQYGSCTGVTAAWGGAAFDAARNRLYITGGGHADYAGNEVYALDLTTLQMSRINQPSFPVRDGCVAGNNSVYADGRPVSRHTYSHLEFLPSSGRVLMFGGSRWQCGFFGNDTWLFNPDADTWTRLPASNQDPNGDFNLGLARDPASGLVYARDSLALHSFDPGSGAWTQRSGEVSISSYKNTVIDPGRQRYYFYTTANSTLFWYDISSATANNLVAQSMPTSNCAFMSDSDAGWQYDPVLDRLVGWSNGNSVSLMHPGTGACATRTYPGGPSAVPAGTFGRFRYAPSMQLYVVCNAIDDDCHALRLTIDTQLLFANGFE